MVKKSILLGAMFFATALVADYVEVKTGHGRNYYDTVQRARLYVCYAKRIKYVSDSGGIYLRYDGCGRYRDSCASNGLARFGKYPSVRSAKNALYRCRTSQPRFVD